MRSDIKEAEEAPMNHPVSYTPDTKEVGLREEIRSLREYLMEMNSSLFSVEELRKLIIPYDPAYAEQYKDWLLRIKKRADAGICGGRHCVLPEMRMRSVNLDPGV